MLESKEREKGTAIARCVNHAMPKRNLRVLKWIGTTPAIATCTLCNQEFRVPVDLLKRVAGAADYLKLQFARHQCKDGDANPSVD